MARIFLPLKKGFKLLLGHFKEADDKNFCDDEHKAHAAGKTMKTVSTATSTLGATGVIAASRSVADSSVKSSLDLEILLNGAIKKAKKEIRH